MNTASLRPGDRLEANVRGIPFLATFDCKVHSNLFRVKDPDPARVNTLHLTPREILRKLDPQERLEVRA
jgi:hypothetical protein